MEFFIFDVYNNKQIIKIKLFYFNSWLIRFFNFKIIEINYEILYIVKLINTEYLKYLIHQTLIINHSIEFYWCEIYTNTRNVYTNH